MGKFRKKVNKILGYNEKYKYYDIEKRNIIYSRPFEREEDKLDFIEEVYNKFKHLKYFFKENINTGKVEMKQVKHYKGDRF